MAQLILSFYLPAFLITILLAVIVSGAYALIHILRERQFPTVSRQQFFYDLLIMNLISVPVMSFAILAILVVAAAH